MIRVLAAAAAIVAAVLSSSAQAETDWKRVEQALGVTGAAQPGGVYRFGLPRSDLKVTFDGVALKPALALGSWLAFKPHGDGAMVMGDLVLTEQEVNPVMTRLIAGGIAITAVHNHLLRASPLPFYMHIEGHGDAAKLAGVIHDALGLSGTPLAPPAVSLGAQPGLDLDITALERALRAKGRAAGGVYQFAIARNEVIRDSGIETPPAMGTATAINFQPTGSGKAAVTGDFVLLPAEVNPVLRVLRENGIDVTALHSHMLNDEPRLFMMHFWANDDALKLAQGLRAALDQTNSARQ
jgi:hypothetical protein